MLYRWLTPVGKPFLVVFDDKIISQIIVTNQGKLTKHHAFGISEHFRKTDLPYVYIYEYIYVLYVGILEHFRKTDLQSGPAWKVVHRIASKFPVVCHINHLTVTLNLVY